VVDKILKVMLILSSKKKGKEEGV